MRAAAKQSRRARVPAVRAGGDSAGLVPLLAAAARALVLHEAADRPLAAQRLPAAGDVLVVVGPEGGIEPDELAMFEQAGAMPVRLGTDGAALVQCRAGGAGGAVGGRRPLVSGALMSEAGEAAQPSRTSNRSRSDHTVPGFDACGSSTLTSSVYVPAVCRSSSSVQ